MGVKESKDGEVKGGKWSQKMGERTLFSDQNLGNESATVLPSNPKFQCLILDHLHSLHALLDTFPLCVHGCSALTCPH